MNKQLTGPQRRLCVSVGAATPAIALDLARQSTVLADLIEIRLDGMAAADPAFFLAALDIPLLFTNRPIWEGGRFDGPETNRLALLSQAVEAGAAYVDIELNTEEGLRGELIATARTKGCKSIVSWHDFKATASAQALSEIFQRQCQSGADIGKIVTTARCFQDVFRVLALQEQAAELGLPLIAFAMGRYGMISRVATTDLGGFMSYAAPDQGEATAPGQLPASVLRRIFTELGHND